MQQFCILITEKEGGRLAKPDGEAHCELISNVSRVSKVIPPSQ